MAAESSEEPRPTCPQGLLPLPCLSLSACPGSVLTHGALCL